MDPNLHKLLNHLIAACKNAEKGSTVAAVASGPAGGSSPMLSGSSGSSTHMSPAAGPSGSSTGGVGAAARAPGEAVDEKSCCVCGSGTPASGSSTGKLLKCGACKVALYCGAQCQKQDWKAGHKAACARFRAEAAD